MNHMNHIAFRPRTIGVSVAFWMLLSGVVAQNQQPRSVPARAPFAGASVSDWRGKVQLQIPGRQPSAPARGQTLPPGTLLDTGDGRLVLRLDDESQILVGPHTRLLFNDPPARDWRYWQLLLGRIRARIKKHTGGAPAFQLGTPTAVITVRGTRFDVEVNERKVTEVDVFEGSVEVAGVGVAGPPVLVEPGFSTRVGTATAPEPPVPTEEIRPDIEDSDQQMESEEGQIGQEGDSETGHLGRENQNIESESEQGADRGGADENEPQH